MIATDSVSNTALTPLSFLERSARVWPDKTAVIYGRRRLTHSELAAEVSRVARALRAAGVEPGDRVAYLMPNLPEMLIAHFAVPLAGGVLVAMNTRLVAEEMAQICAIQARSSWSPTRPCCPRPWRPRRTWTRYFGWWRPKIVRSSPRTRARAPIWALTPGW